MKCWLPGWCLLVTIAVVAQWARASALDGGVFRGTDRIISRDEIAQSGAARLSDVLRLIPGWFDYSVDGFTWGVVPDVLDLPRQESWMLLIDGQQVDVRILGNLEINALGLDVGLIDSVEVFSTPVIRRGIMAPHGLVHVHTRPPKRYYELQGSISVGNSTGDPGPFLFTPHESPNIDRIGPASSASAAAGGRNWYVRGAMKHDEHHITDPRIWPRVWLLFQDPIQVRQQLLAQRFDARWFLAGGEAGVSIDNFRLHQFRFVEQLGVEVPVSLVYLRFASAGDIELYPGVRAFYSGRYSVAEIDPRPNSDDLYFDFRENSGFGAAGLSIELPEAKVEVGASREVRNLHTDDALTHSEVSITGAYATLASEMFPGFLGSATFDLRSFEGKTVPSALGSVAYSYALGQIVISGRLHGAHVRSPAWTGSDLWFWTQRGFNFLERAGAEGTLPPSPLSLPERQWAELSAGASWRKYGSLTVSGAYSRFTHRTIPVYERHLEYRDVGLFEREAHFFATQFRLETPVAGELLRGSVESLFTPIRGLTHRAHYSYTLPLSENAPFRDLWAAVPDHQLDTSVTYAPETRVSVQVRLRLDSWSEWPEYATVDRSSGGGYPSRVPAHVSLDFSVRKQFWKDHLEASVILTNLLNRHVQRHPAARVEPITMWARAEVRL